MSAANTATAIIRVIDALYALDRLAESMGVNSDELRAEFKASREEGRPPNVAHFANKAVLSEARAREHFKPGEPAP